MTTPLDTHHGNEGAKRATHKSNVDTHEDGQYILFEGLRLPPLLRPRSVERIFAIGHGVLYGHLNAGRIASIALREKPEQHRSTRLVYTRSIIEFLHRCEATDGVAKVVVVRREQSAPRAKGSSLAENKEQCGSATMIGAPATKTPQHQSSP